MKGQGSEDVIRSLKKYSIILCVAIITALNFSEALAMTYNTKFSLIQDLELLETLILVDFFNE